MEAVIPTLTLIAEQVAQKRYYRKDNDGNVIEDWSDLSHRVVNYVCKKETEQFKEQMYDLLYHTKFLPNTPCLVNAGRETKAKGLSACYVTKAPEDSWKEIVLNIERFGDVARAAGGCGVSFSKIRPEGDPVFGSAHAKACGPIEAMRMVSEAMASITQSGIRGMAMMATLHVSHPDIINFIKCKQRERALKNLLKEDIFDHFNQLNGKTHEHLNIILDKFISNFNISVFVSDAFMEAVENNSDWELSFNGKIYLTMKARELFYIIIENSWKNGDPGLLFEDIINNCPYKYSGQYIDATNPCSEQTLPYFGACNLGSIDVSKLYDAENNEIDWKSFRKVIHASIRFLDNVVDMNVYPGKEFSNWAKDNRPVGLGIMGLADLFLKMKIKYGSKKSLEVAEEIAKFLEVESNKASIKLAQERGTPKACEYKELHHRRNVTLTSIAPTGSISLLAGCSSSIEPIFSPVIHRYDNTGQYVIKHVDSAKSYFKCALDSEQNGEREVSWKEHILMQAAFQKYGSSGISKTINMPNSATIEDVKKAYMFAWHNKCKGITIYRDGCKTTQVLNTERKVGVVGYNNAEKRSKELDCDIFKATADGIDWHIIIGLKDGNPYELFAVNGKINLPDKGKVIKKKKRYYSLVDENKQVLIDNLIEEEKGIDPKISLETRRFSLELRHQIHPKYLCSQIDKSNEHLTSFSKAVNRIFKRKYISAEEYSSAMSMACPICAKDGKNVEMTPESGCWVCQICQYSRCG